MTLKIGDYVAPHGEPSDFFLVGNEDLSAMRVYLRYKLFRALDNLALKDTSSDQAGLLLGKFSTSASNEAGWIKVDEAVEVRSVEGKFPESVWQSAREAAAKSHPGLEVVGWFHSHPDTGVGLSPLDIEVHTHSFREPHQVVYIMDPLLRERGFHVWQNGKLSFASGFRIYGKEEKVMTNMATDQENLRPDEHLRERYLERSVEKLQKMVRKPSIRPIDYIIIGLQVLIISLLLLRPAPVAKVDQTELIQAQAKIGQDVADLVVRNQKLEEHLKALGVLDAELGLQTDSKTVSSEPASEVEPKPEVSESPTPVAESVASTVTTTEQTGQVVDGVKIGAKVRLHRVTKGETLSLIAEKYYQSSEGRVCRALGKYNKLRSPNYDIYLDDVLKIPEKSVLGI